MSRHRNFEAYRMLQRHPVCSSMPYAKEGGVVIAEQESPALMPLGC